MKIVRISKHNADIVAKIHQECFSKAWSEEDFKKFLDNRFNYVLMMIKGDNHMILPMGFVMYSKVEDEVELLTICTRKKYRRAGVAKTLMSAIDAKKMFLEVNENNYEAISLYEHLGFKATNVRKKYYDGKDNAIVMEKK